MDKDRFYYDEKFLGSMSGRPLRILSEYLGPLSTLQRNKIIDTIVVFGSARLKEQNEYYQKTRDLAFRLTKWSMDKYKDEHRYVITSGGGPGIMEAANKGAKEAGGKSIGLGISLPFEETNNKWITKRLNFVFHYFFMRKFWFIYKTKGIVVFPGGFGTLDELFDVLTLLQCKKVTRKVPIILFGNKYWDGLINWDHMIENKTISKSDLKLFVTLDTANDTFDYLVNKMQK
jgi:hypothetical protein